MNEEELRAFLEAINPDLLDHHDEALNEIQSPAALRRTHATTLALLQHAYDLIDKAEQQLDAQSTRIASLENLAVTDELTGIYNRRGFEGAVKQELERLHRHQIQGGAFALIDLDDFKPINDRHGHYVGDLCLKAVATCLKDITRSTDVVGRIGGDEFAVYLGDIDEDRAQAKLARINHELYRLQLHHQGEAVAIGASLGYIMIDDQIRSYNDLYDQADRMMYDRKSARKHTPRLQAAGLLDLARLA